MKHPLLLGTAGHIDHGKTALVKALTGVDTDRLPEEKARQITIDLGFAPLEVGEYSLGIVDVPGHERFVKNMLAGATGIDLALLVVAVDDSVKPQTREHLEILEYMRLPAGVIALTKCDLAAADWMELVESEVRELVEGTFLERAAMVRVSAKTGEGLAELGAEIAQACKLAAAARENLENSPLRMPIDRAFTIAGYGVVVTGGIASGQVHVGDTLVLHPQGTSVRVRGLQNHDRQVEQLARGQRAAVNLSGIHYDEVARGQSLCTPGALVPSKLITVSFKLSKHAKRPLKQSSQLRLHVGTAETPVRIRLLGRAILRAGEETFAQLSLEEEIAALWGQPFVLRAMSPVETLGGGQILDAAATWIRRFEPAMEAQLVDLASDDSLKRTAAAVFLRGLRAWQTSDLFTMAGVLNPAEVAEALLERDVIQKVVETSSEGRLLHAAVLDEVCDRIVNCLQMEHEKTPLKTVVEQTRLSTHFARLDTALFGALLSYLAEKGQLLIERRGLTRAGWQPEMSDGQRKLLEDIVGSYRAAGLRPTSLAELSTEHGQPTHAIIPLLDFATEQRSLVRIGDGIYVHASAIAEAKDRLVQQFAEGEKLAVSQIRELLGTSRKIAVPLCEYFDRIGFTRREGDFRQLVNQPTSACRTDV